MSERLEWEFFAINNPLMYYSVIRYDDGPEGAGWRVSSADGTRWCVYWAEEPLALNTTVLTLDEAKALAQRLQDALDGEPREPECPTNHMVDENQSWIEFLKDAGLMRPFIGFHCPDCGASLKGTP